MRYGELIQQTTTGALFEAPKAIAPTTFGLDDRATNQVFTARHMQRVTEVIEDTPDWQLVRTGDQRNGWVLLYNRAQQTVDYAVQYTARNWRLLPPSVTQCVLWRNPGSVFARGITSRVFFDYLLKRHPAIISDGLQTQAGNEFWVARMADAVAKNLEVGVVNLYQRKITWFDPVAGPALVEWLRTLHTYGPQTRLRGVRYLIAS